MKSLIVSIICILLLHSCKVEKEKETESEVVTKIEVFDDEISQVIDTTAKIEILADGFTWSEGPLWLPSEDKLIFSDVPENTIYSWNEKDGKQLYLQPSGYTIDDPRGGKEGSNGLALTSDNELLLCQHGDRALAKMFASPSTPKDTFQVLANHYKGKKFNSPNDLHIAQNGDIYFTDPPYGLPGLDKDSIKELSFNGVFLIKTDGNIILLDSTLTKPNGIALSSDERTMYVANSDPEKAIWKRYQLDASKQIISSDIFADKTELVSTKKGLPDGLKINRKGYIFATGPGGVLIFNKEGTHLGTINTGVATANCGFDPTEKYLYMTAHNYLMRLKLK